MTAIPNALMIRFLTVAETGGNAGMDEAERYIAVAVGIEYGWMLDAVTLTDEGRAFTSVGTATPEISVRPRPVEAPPTKTSESMAVAIANYRLHAQQGLSIHAIARQENVEPSTVMRRIKRVKDGMKALVG